MSGGDVLTSRGQGGRVAGQSVALTANLRILGDAALRVAPFVLLVGLWQVVAALEVFPHYLFPPPSTVVDSFRELIGSSQLPTHLRDSFIRVLIGYIPGIGGALLLGVAMGSSTKITKFFTGPISFFNAIPSLGWIPLAILWFGIGYGAVTFIIFLSVFFPVLLGTLNGIATIPSQFVNVAKMCEVSRLRIVWQVLIPGAMPSIVTGVRIGAAYGWRALIAAEMIASTSGIGFMMNDARQYLRSDVVIVGMITIGVCWILIDYLVLRRIERHTVMRWGMVGSSRG